jgi:hypothetical protein
MAGRQHGVVADWQLLPLGLGHGAIDYRVALGRLHVIHRGVYAVGHSKLSLRGRWMAAVLACGPAAVLSHRDAGELWSIGRWSRPKIDVTAPGRSRHARPGIDVHRPRLIEPDECTIRDGIPVTTISRTLIDLAAVVSLKQLTRAWDASVREQHFDLTDLVRVRSRFRRRRGLKHIDLLIAQSRPLPPRVNSNTELDVLDLIHNDPDVPNPTGVNVWIPEAHAEVDLEWHHHRAVVEIDGPHHLEPRQRDEDNARDARLQKAGYRVMRVSDRRIADDPYGVMVDVAGLLASCLPRS